ncbi:AMP-binding protein [Pseudonocardia sp. TRM90224]|uniref:AMP-binding protein n=1 Tax=Pseudonocardia sp. TRM90224 TaxID=2812678 RepID=UPI001E4A1438|nr:AMP-binding protein [Pseudonocardia sp. TRM90224]
MAATDESRYGTDARGGPTVPDLLARRAATDPGRLALVVDGGGSLTYGEWHRRAEQVARGLVERGVRPTDRVGLVFGGTAWTDFAVAYCGVLLAGATAVPLSAAMPAAQLTACLEHCEAAAVIHSAGASVPAGTGWAASIDDVTAGATAEESAPCCSPHTTAQILYTSGTTGRPKAVAASHANLVFEHVQRPYPPPLAHSEHALHAFPLGTNAGQAMLVKALYMHPTTVVMPRFDPERFCSLVQSYQVGSVFCVPAMWIALVNWDGHRRFDLSSVLLLGSSAAALPPAVAARLTDVFAGALLVNQYTSTEASPAHTLMVYDPDRPGSLGRPDDGAAVSVTDADGEPVPRGELGEIWLELPAGLARRYYRDDARSADVFRDGRVRTGDIGYLDGDGYLYLVDRESDIVNSGGRKIAGLDVENALYAHPDVAEAAAFGVPHPVLGEMLTAAVVLRSPVSTERLRAFLRDTLAESQVPQRIVTVDALPRNANGKVVKRELRERLGRASRPDAGDRPPAGTTEALLTTLWQDALRRPRIGADECPLDLGADSIMAGQVAAAAGDALGIEVPIALLFDHPTVAGQAAALDLLLSPDRSAAAPVRRAGPRTSAPAGVLQEKFWRWVSADPGRRQVPNVVAAIRIRGSLDVGALSCAVAEIVRRHEALRTAFRHDGDRLVQAIDPAAGIELDVVDLSSALLGIPLTGRSAVARERLDHDATAPFDLSTAPLVRALLYRLGPVDHVFAVAASHLVVDGLSLGVILSELEVLYAAYGAGYSAGRGSALLEPPLQYADFVAWEQNLLPTGRAFWKQELGSVPPHPSSEPGDTAVHALSAVRFAVPAAVTSAVRRLGRSGVTPFMTMATLYAHTAAETLGADSVLLTTPLSGRSRPELGAVVGCLCRAVYLRHDLSDRPDWPTALDRMRETALAAFAHQHFPHHEFSTGYDPLACSFRYLDTSHPTRLRGLHVERFATDLQPAQDLPAGTTPESRFPELLIEDFYGELTGTLVYNPADTDAAAVEGIAESFLRRAERVSGT